MFTTSIARKIVLVATLSLVSGLVCAQTGSSTEPSAHQIYEAASSGHLRQAEDMVEQVLRSHPNNAKAHYVAAEVYSRAGDSSRARGELATAERLQPGLTFASPRAVGELRAKLGVGSRPFAFTGRSGSGSFPWGWIVLFGAAAVALWAVLRRRSYANQNATFPDNPPMGSSASGYGAGSQYGTNYGPGYSSGYNPGSGGGMGSRLAGGLAAGLGIGAGVVAGEALAHHFLDGDKPARSDDPGLLPGTMPDSNDDMGGQDFGLDPGESSSWADDSGSWDSGDSGGDWS